MKDLRLNQGQAKKLDDAIDLVSTYVAQVAATWPALTPQKRQQVLDHSPRLARIVMEIARPLDGD